MPGGPCRLHQILKTACMKKKRLLLLSLLFLFSAATYAQHYTITGTITDARTGEKMQGVSIGIDNMKHGVVTRADGTYTITVNGDSKVLNFSFVGYTAKS